LTEFQPKTHQTHKESLWRFIALLALLIGYFIYVSWQYDAATGGWLALLSWSFFVLCTPVADGGFIIAFPVRLLFGMRMITTQIFVWIVAIGINTAAITISPQTYQNTVLTRLLHEILTNPWPNWSILFISAAGTGFSIWFGDEMMDVTHHSKRAKHHHHGFNHKILIVASLAILTIVAYYQVLSGLGLSAPA